MRFFASVLLCALLLSCGPKPELTPPIQAPAPAPEVDAEVPPAGRLPADTRPESYRIQLEVDPDKAGYRGTVSIDVTLDRPRESIWLHSRGPRVEQATLQREGAGPLRGRLERVGDSGLSALRLGQPVGPGRVTITLEFEADFGTHLTGLYKAAAGGASYAFTQFEPVSAREAFPCFDEPRFKTPFTLSLRVQKQHAAIANTRVASERTLEDGRRELTFAPTEKLPTYLIAFAVGALDVVPAPGLPATEVRPHELPFGGVAVGGRGPELSYALAETPPLLSWLERYFGVAYPYDKLDLIAVPDFGAGAMENAGAITFRDTLLLVKDDASEQQKRSLSYVNAHELSHQWFGNLVTMPWWDDIWLNEAFATWMGTRAVSAVHPEYEAELGALSATQGAMEIDSRTSARKIRQPIESDHDIENAFDAITYSKGGAVLSMFERYLGADKFQAGLRLYMQRFRFGSATARDLVHTLAEVSGERALEPAFFSFLEQPGVPLLQVKLDCTSNPPALDIEQSRYLPLGTTVQGSSRWQIPFCARFSQAGGLKEQCVLLSEPRTRVPLDAPVCPQWIMPNAGASGYYRWALSDKALDSLVARRSDLSALEQMSLASNVAAALKAGRIEPERAVATQKLLVVSPHRHVMESALKTFWLVRELLDDSSLPTFRSEMAKLLRPSYLKLGLVPRSAQVSGEEKLRRSSLVRALFGLAEDPALTRELAALGTPLLMAAEPSPGDKPSHLPKELLEVALSASVRLGGAPVFDRAEAQLFASSDGLQRSRLLNALSYVREPALGQRVLQLGLDPRLRTNERLLPLFGQLGQAETRDGAFDWLRANFDALQALLGAHGGNDVIAAAAGFCSEEKAREVEGFFAPKSTLIPGGPRELLLTLESIRSCAALSSAYAEKIRGVYKPKPLGR
ncbi:MAG: Membrane alanine aminopeptidase [Myxococcaceae bacterium]|nr:Membrane alanine aminopeptidase [Myxococcaceae bacterium]